MPTKAVAQYFTKCRMLDTLAASAQPHRSTQLPVSKYSETPHEGVEFDFVSIGTYAISPSEIPSPVSHRGYCRHEGLVRNRIHEVLKFHPRLIITKLCRTLPFTRRGFLVTLCISFWRSFRGSCWSCDFTIGEHEIYIVVGNERSLTRTLVVVL